MARTSKIVRHQFKRAKLPNRAVAILTVAPALFLTTSCGSELVPTETHVTLSPLRPSMATQTVLGRTTSGWTAGGFTEAHPPAGPGAQTPVRVEQIVMGEGHMCALLDDSTVRCWGGRLTEEVCDACTCRAEGRGAGGWSSVERSLPGLAGVVSLAASDSHTCAVVRDGTVRCWGGDESVVSTGANNPVAAIDGIRDVVSLTTRHLETCALLGDGTVRCWGGSVRPNDPNNFVAGWFGIQELTASTELANRNFGVSCVRSILGEVECRGTGTFCSPQTSSEPVSLFLPALRGTSHISTNGNSVCGINAEGTPTCVLTHYNPECDNDCADNVDIFGENSTFTRRCYADCQCNYLGCRQHDIQGPGPGPDSSRAFLQLTANSASQISSRDDSSCAVRSTGDVTCWGIEAKESRERYMVPDGSWNGPAGPDRERFSFTGYDFIRYAKPKVARALTGARQIVRGSYEGANACVLRLDNGIQCFTVDDVGAVTRVQLPFYLLPEAH